MLHRGDGQRTHLELATALARRITSIRSHNVGVNFASRYSSALEDGSLEEPSSSPCGHPCMLFCHRCEGGLNR